jgi:hypothetical protein
MIIEILKALVIGGVEKNWAKKGLLSFMGLKKI